MKSTFAIAGHPVHPMLIPFPVAFYTATVASYIAYAATANPLWFKIGHVANVAGVIMAALAAIPGIVDWAKAIPRNNAAKKTGLIHMSLNTAALLLFLANAIVQNNKWDAIQPEVGGAVSLTVLGLLCTVIAGAYGWTLTQKHHIGIDLTPEQERLEPANPERIFNSSRRNRAG